MKRKFLTASGGIGLLFLFPWIVTLFLTGKIVATPEEIPESGRLIQINNEFGTSQIDLEEYAVGVAAAQIPPEYEEEALKAQVIIARTYLYKIMGEETVVDSRNISCEYWDLDARKKAWGTNFEEYQEKFFTAGSETAGLVILYEGNLIDPMFHRASGGMTRDGGEAFPYLESVSGDRDVDMENYVTIREISGTDIQAAVGAIRGQTVSAEEALGLQIAARDSAGYVQTVMIGAQEYSGDEIALALGFPSSSFSVSAVEQGLKFVVKGSGHGYGLSQWGANKLAAEGQDAAAILSAYYRNISLEKR